MKMRYQKIILAVIILVFVGSNCVKLPPQFWKVFNSLKGSTGATGATVKSKLIYGFLKINLYEGKWYKYDHDEQFECNASLMQWLMTHDAMAHDLKCPRATNELKHFLGIMEFSFNMTRDEKFVRSVFESNCTYLSGRSVKVCQLILSRGTPDVRYNEWSQIMHGCHSEHLEQGGDRSELFYGRSDTSVQFLPHCH